MASLTKVKREPLPVTINGNEYKLATLSLGGMRRVQAWLDGRPSPLDRVRAYAAELPEDLRARKIAEAAEAMATWPPKLGHPTAGEHLTSVEGIYLILSLMLRRAQPGLTDAQIEALVDEIDTDDPEIVAFALGTDGEGTDPKAAPSS